MKEAGGINHAVVKEFKGVRAAEALRIDLIPKAGKTTPATAPVLSGVEIEEEHK